MAREPKAAELRPLADAEIARRAAELKETLFNLRIELRTGELHQPSKIKAARRELARLYTLQRERALGIERGAPSPTPAAKSFQGEDR